MTLYQIRKADQKEHSPVNAEQVRQLIRDGQAFARTLAKVDGTNDWKQLSEFPEFREALAAVCIQPSLKSVEPLPVATVLTPQEPCRLASASRNLGLIALGASFSLIAGVILLSPGSLAPFILLCFTVMLAASLASIIAGLVALFRIRKSHGQLGGQRLAATGLMASLLPLLLLLIAVPNFVKMRNTPSGNACINNLRELDGAKEQWALENKRTLTDTPTMTDLVGTDKYIKITPQCPANGVYTLGNMGTKPACSIDGHTLY